MMNVIPAHELLATYMKVSKNFYSHVDRSSEKELLGWTNKESQTIRFQVIVEEAVKNFNFSKDSSILDVGCGYAALYTHMQQAGIPARFTGIDINPMYLREAKKIHPHISLRECNIFDLHYAELETHDVVCMSGVLNINIDRLVGEKGANFRLLEIVLNDISPYAKKGLICNFLDVRYHEKYDFFVYHDHKQLISFLTDRGYKILNFRDKYLPNDFTLSFR